MSKKWIRDMDEPELKRFLNTLARKVEAAMPPGPNTRGKCMFLLIVADTIGPGVAQYVSNVQRSDAIKMLRETADRLESREDVTR